MNTSLFDTEGITRSERMLHTPSGYAKKNLSYVQEIGRLQSLKAHSSIRENLESYLLFLVLEGEGHVVYQGTEYPVKKGELAFIDCRMHYEHKSSEEHPWELMWVHFNGNLPQAYYPLFIEKNNNSPVICPKEGTEPYQAVLEHLMERQKERTLLSELESSHDLSALLLLCMKEVVRDEVVMDEAENSGLKRSDYEGIREYINEHFADAGLESALAIHYGVASQELSRTFEKKYGISLKAYIENRKFTKAKELLRFTIKPVPEIITESGIDSDEEFRRLFMDNEEMTPEEYRRKWAQWIKG